MTIKNFKRTFAFEPSVKANAKISYLVFGGQGSVFVSKFEYYPAKKQVKLLSRLSTTSATVSDLLLFPDDTEILIEGYPGDDITPLEWVTPDEVEFINGTVDFQRLLTDEQHKMIHDAREELYVIMENLKNQDVPEEYITKIFQEVIKDI